MHVKHRAELEEIRFKHQEKLERNRRQYLEDLEEIRTSLKEKDDRISELTGGNSIPLYRLLVENYHEIRNKNCDLTLEFSGGKTLDVHKTILMGNKILD
jgi:hypothetical protein